MKFDKMSSKERSLLLYFESRIVDNNGCIDTKHINSEDKDIAECWKEEGFIEYKRIPMAVIEKRVSVAKNETHHVLFSEEAWEFAHKERRARHVRTFKKFKEHHKEDLIDHKNWKKEFEGEVNE